jgi:uncharacterized membrane protein
MADKTVVLSIFENEAAADAAVASLKASGTAHHDAIGVLVLDQNGEIKTHKVGAHSTGKGAGIGFLLYLLGPAGVGIGVVGGALLGRLHHKGLGMSEADRDRISAELADGKAAVGVLAHAGEADVISAALSQAGGVSETHAASDEVLEAAASDADAPAAPA